MIGYNLTDKEPNSQYVVAQAFTGEYEITVSRVYGQPLGNRARLEIIQNAGTTQQTRRIEIIQLDNNVPMKIQLKNGRRTEMATVSPAASQRHRPQTAEQKSGNTFDDLRSAANPNYFGAVGAAPSGGAGALNQLPSAMAARDSQNAKQQMSPGRPERHHPRERGRRADDRPAPRLHRSTQRGHGHPSVLRHGQPGQPSPRQSLRHPRRRQLIAGFKAASRAA